MNKLTGLFHTLRHRCSLGSIHGLWVTFVLVASISCDEPRNTRPEAQVAAAKKPTAAEAAMKSGVTLEVAVILGAPGGTLSFTLKNLQQVDFETTPLATNYNRILITAPDGHAVEHFHWKDGIRPVVVKASEQTSWKVDMGPVLESRELKGAGTYRLRWQVGEVKSEEILLLRE